MLIKIERDVFRILIFIIGNIFHFASEWGKGVTAKAVDTREQMKIPNIFSLIPSQSSSSLFNVFSLFLFKHEDDEK